MNQVIIKGRLGRDPEARYLPSGTMVTEFSVATDYKPKDKEPVTEWHNIVAFNKQAEVITEHFVKGQEILLTGRLQTDRWEKDGVAHYKTRIILDRFEFCGSKADNEGAKPKKAAEPSYENLPF